MFTWLATRTSFVFIFRTRSRLTLLICLWSVLSVGLVLSLILFVFIFRVLYIIFSVIFRVMNLNGNLFVVGCVWRNFFSGDVSFFVFFVWFFIIFVKFVVDKFSGSVDSDGFFLCSFFCCNNWVWSLGKKCVIVFVCEFVMMIFSVVINILICFKFIMIVCLWYSIVVEYEFVVVGLSMCKFCSGILSKVAIFVFFIDNRLITFRVLMCIYFILVCFDVDIGIVLMGLILLLFGLL